MKFGKKLLLWALLAALLFTAAAAAEDNEDPLAQFAIRHGRRDEKKIAVTVDDSFDLAYTWKIRDLFQELGVVGTFFPIGKQRSAPTTTATTKWAAPPSGIFFPPWAVSSRRWTPPWDIIIR